ncbi:MAG: aminotransferase class IV [Paracoccaceae bacterium]|nr:aminotransferase class IV [Paracoccaceae bacterium]
MATSVQRIPDGSLNPAVKNYRWGDFTRGLFEAREKNFETVIFLDQSDHITEGPRFNVFAVKGDTALTFSHSVLGGITRRSVLEINHTLGLSVKIAQLPRAKLLSADAVFILSSAGA